MVFKLSAQLKTRFLSLEALLLLLIIFFGVFFSFWKINTVPRDLDFDPIMLALSSWRLAPGDEVEKTHLENLSRYDTGEEFAIRHSYIFPFVHVVKLPILKILGAIDTQKILLVEAILSVSVVILTYILGTKMFNKWVGLLGAFFLATSSSFLMINRNPLGYPIISLLTLLLTIYFFYRAHDEQNKKYLFLSAISLSLVFLTEWAGTVIGPALLFFAFLFLPKNKKFGFYFYPLCAFLAVTSYAFLKFFYISLFHLSPQEVLVQFKSIVAFSSSLRAVQFDPVQSIQTVFSQIFIGTKQLESSYYGEYLGAYLPGAPIIAWPLSFFFLIGILKSLWERSLAQRMLLVWVFVVFLAYPMRYLPLPRYLMLAYPAAFLLVATGIIFIANWVKNTLTELSFKIAGTIFSVGLAVMLIGFSIFFYFLDLGGYEKKMNDSDFNGFGELFSYVEGLGPEEKTQIVLGDGLSMRYTFVIPQIPEKNYKIIYWANLIGNPISDITNYQAKPLYPWNPWDKKNKNELANWEREVFSQKDKIVYVFASTYSMTEVRQRLSSFLDLHPDANPAKKILNSDGTIRMLIYVIEKRDTL